MQQTTPGLKCGQRSTHWLGCTWRNTRTIWSASFSLPALLRSFLCKLFPGLPKQRPSLTAFHIIPATWDHWCSWMWLLFCDWQCKKAIEVIVTKKTDHFKDLYSEAWLELLEIQQLDCEVVLQHLHINPQAQELQKIILSFPKSFPMRLHWRQKKKNTPHMCIQEGKGYLPTKKVDRYSFGRSSFWRCSLFVSNRWGDATKREM